MMSKLREEENMAKKRKYELEIKKLEDDFQGGKRNINLKLEIDREIILWELKFVMVKLIEGEILLKKFKFEMK